MQVSELVRITMKFRGSENSTEHFMHRDQVSTFLSACLELHFHPGINPYTKGKTSELWEVCSAELAEPKAYWWSTVGLGKFASAKGAEVSSFHQNCKRLWAHPDLIRQERLQEEAENRAAERMGW